MKKRNARRKDWRASPIMPKEKEYLEFDQIYSVKEYQKIKRGYIPDELEDPWFMYLENDALYIHPNDGIGRCVYQVRFERVDDNYQVVEAWASRDTRKPLPSNDRNLISFADAYNQDRGSIYQWRPVSIQTKNKQVSGSQSERSAAEKDVSILKYLIDHWLVRRK
jgi:hypothetical protein